MAFREAMTGLAQVVEGAFAGNDSGNAPTMLMLGGFKFALNTAVFQTMQRSTSFRWPAQERTGQYDALQFTGPGDDRITLPGIIYPDFRGSIEQVENLRRLGAGGKPLRLITAGGGILGLWVIENVEETQSYFKPDGTPRKQEFTVAIKKYGNA